jgi:hypothetical protein
MVILLRTILMLMMTGLFVALIVTAVYTLGRRVEQAKRKNKQGALPSDAGVRDMLLEGRVDDALEAYRQFTGVDRFTAQKAIEQMQRELRLENGVRDEVRHLLKSGDKAGAIEAYQMATGASLADALNYVENLEGRRS